MEIVDSSLSKFHKIANWFFYLRDVLSSEALKVSKKTKTSRTKSAGTKFEDVIKKEIHHW